MSHREFRFFLSCDINSPIAYRVDGLQGKPFSSLKSFDAENDLESHAPELYVECALYIDGASFALPTRTRLDMAGNSEHSNDFTTLSAKYRDLTAESQLAFTVWDVSSSKQDTVIGGATLRLFNKKKQLRTGQQKLRLWPGKKADGSVDTTTPGKVPKAERGEVERLEKLLNKYNLGQVTHIEWLDELAFRAIEKIKEKESRSLGTSHLHLIINLWPFEHPVAFQMIEGCPPFAASTDEEVVQAYINGERPAFKASSRHYPHGLKELIEQCWNEDPSQRPTFAEIIHKLDTITNICRRKNLWKGKAGKYIKNLKGLLQSRNSDDQSGSSNFSYPGR